jgi:hypothetical protein
MIVNLTPHPMHIYPADTPERIAPGSVSPIRVIAPSTQYPPARLGQRVIGEDGSIEDGITVDLVAFGPSNGQVTLPEPREGIWYLVALVVGLAAAHRADLLVPHEYVRDLDGCIIGSRKLARPATAATTPAKPTERAVTAAATPSRPNIVRPWCNYSTFRTTSDRRDAGGKAYRVPHGVSKRRWRRRINDWWRQHQPTPAAPAHR